MSDKKRLSEEILQEIIRRIVNVAQPERIILVGSAARGEMGPHSDVDLLVIKGGEFHQGCLTGEIYMNLHGVGQAVDIILVTPEQVEQYRNTRFLVIAPALQEGKEIYHA
jgi:predicted nucleotidyltransferase